MRETVETTYADLRPNDLVIDKSGFSWSIGDWTKNYNIDHEVTSVEFWLLDPASKVQMHYMTKPGGDPVTVSRVPDEAGPVVETSSVVSLPPHDDAVDLVVGVLGGEVEVTYTEKEADAAKAATDDSPVRLPAFEDMTILEMRSHLYLLHGVYAHDMKSRVDTIAMHDEAHADHEAGKLNSRHVPHVHEVK